MNNIALKATKSQAQHANNLISAWELIDMGETIANIDLNFKKPHNQQKDIIGDRKNRFKGNEKEVAVKLAYWAVAELERMRKDCPSAYKLIMNDKDQDLIVYTNRASLRTALDYQIKSLNTFSRIIRILTEADFITKKQNTNRVPLGCRGEIVDGGRGNLRLSINRKVFAEKFTLRSLKPVQSKNEKKSEKSESIDNQDIPQGKIQNLHRYGHNISDTLIINKNKSGKGLASQNRECILTDTNGFSEDTNDAITPSDTNQVKPVEIERKFLPGAENYLNKVRTDQKVGDMVPKKGRDREAHFLYFMILKMIYPEMSLNEQSRKRQQACWLLKMMLDRVMTNENCDNAAAFSKISRGIYLAGRYATEYEKKNGKKWQFYSLLTWLEMDNGYTNSLWNVVDNWVKNEEKRQAQIDKSQKDRVRWVTVRSKIEILVYETMNELSYGFSRASIIFEKSKKRLNLTLGKLKVSDENRLKAIREFSDRVQNALLSAKETAEYENTDPISRTFSEFQLLNCEGGDFKLTN